VAEEVTTALEVDGVAQVADVAYLLLIMVAFTVLVALLRGLEQL
jgi:hypothetical protein